MLVLLSVMRPQGVVKVASDMDGFSLERWTADGVRKSQVTPWPMTSGSPCFGVQSVAQCGAPRLR